MADSRKTGAVLFRTKVPDCQAGSAIFPVGIELGYSEMLCVKYYWSNNEHAFTVPPSRHHESHSCRSLAVAVSSSAFAKKSKVDFTPYKTFTLGPGRSVSQSSIYFIPSAVPIATTGTFSGKNGKYSFNTAGPATTTAGRLGFSKRGLFFQFPALSAARRSAWPSTRKRRNSRAPGLRVSQSARPAL